MPLSAGDRLGPYEILASIGAGGMGEVYKARDTRLDRTVAVKVAKTEFTERFERESRAVAALNHPHICQLYDVGPNYLVMEYLEGTPVKGPLPLDQALNYAAQICDALDAAHRKNITHRDLKPANILVTRAGVKLLDFGLAKIGPVIQADEATMSMALTGKSEIVGTLIYMSPEQLQSAEIDTRSDIFSFGLVLYEMLTGKRAFYGTTAASIIAAILERPAPSVAEIAPEALDRIVRKCLAKDPDNRWQTARDLKDELEWVAESPEPEKPPDSPRRARFAGFAAAFALIAAVALFFVLRNRPVAVLAAPTRLAISLPVGQEVTDYPAISPDGRTVAYIAQLGAEEPQLYLRDLSSFDARAVTGSSGAKKPFFSPDGKWVAFFAQGQLQKAEVTGGSPIRIAEAAFPFGGTWSEDNTIVYVASLGSGLLRVPANGGTPESLTKPDGGAQGYGHFYPQALPGGHSVLFTVWGQTPGGAVLSLDSKRWNIVLPEKTGASIFARTLGSAGHILLIDDAAGVRAAPFDAAHPARTTAEATVLAGVYYEETEQRAWLAVSSTGTAVYAPGNPAKRSLVWVDQEGKVESLGKAQDVYAEVALSPDGTKAVARHGFDLWTHDLLRGTRSRLTTGDAGNALPLWSRDGKRILFSSNRGGDWDIYSQPADASGPAEVLLKRPYDQFPMSVLADGTLLYTEINPQSGLDLWILSPNGPDGKGTTSPLRVTPTNEWDGQFSPAAGSGSADGPRWVAYSSDESGRSEIYVQAYPSGANRVAVSNGGGLLPRWSRDGKELYYVTGDAVVAVAMRPDGSFGPPRRLFDRASFLIGSTFQSYDVSPDSKRFLMIQRDPGSVPRQLNMIMNWSGELDRLAPAGK